MIFKSNVPDSIDLFDIVQSRFERDTDYVKLQGQRLDWFSQSGVRLHTYQEPAGDLTPCTYSHLLTNFVVNTSQILKLKKFHTPVDSYVCINNDFDSKNIY